MAEALEARAGGARLVSGMAWNALGRGLPLLLALALTPLLVALMGLERWGLFTLALAMVGVFGVLDLGLGPALTRALSARLGGAADPAETGRLVGGTLAALLLVSGIGAAALWFLLPWLIGAALNVPPALQGEALAAFRILACAAPLVVINAALWGVLAAHQRFRAANLVTIPVAAMYYIGPALVLLAWQSLIGVMLALVACRLANTLSYVWLCRGLLPPLSLGGPRLVLPLLAFGGWMTASSLLNQALLYADRFLIGAMLTLAAVAHYATPLDLVLRLWIVPVAVAQALLPAMASGFRRLPEATAGLLRRGALLVLALVLPACLLLAAQGGFLLRLWLGAEFAAEGGWVLRALAVGMFFSCLAFVPNALLEAVGRPDAVTRFLLLQVLVFVPLSALLLWGFGIGGAAVAWALRAAADAAGKLRLALRHYPAAEPAARAVLPAVAAGAGALALGVVLPEGAWSSAAAVLGLAAAAALALRALTAEERRALGPLLRRPWEARRLLQA